MSIRLKLKNSVVQDSTPSTSDLPEVGELAVNANINSIGGFMRASNNTIVKIFGPGSLSTPTATTTVSGISELATTSETTTGTATNRVVTPAGLNAVTVAERTTSNTNYVAKAGSTLTGVLTMPNGSNSAPAINFGDSDSGIFGGTNTVSLAAGGTTRLTADTGVSVVGTLAVTGAITSTSDLTIADKIIHSGDTNTAIRFPAADTVSIETSSSERARIDSAGRFLVGTSTARAVGGAGDSLLQIEGANAKSQISIIRNQASNAGPALSFGKTRGGSVGGTTVVQSGDKLGTIRFNGADGTDLVSDAASIVAEVDGTPGANDMPGRLVFSTTADGASSSTERLRIDSAGTSTFTGNIVTTGTLNGKDVVLTDTTPSIFFNDSSANPDYEIQNANGVLKIRDTTNSATRFAVNTDGHIDIAGNLDCASGVDVTGSINATTDITLASTTAGQSIIITKDGTQAVKLGHIGTGNEGLLVLKEGGTDTVKFNGSTGGTSFINAGNVGIGTTNPGSLLNLSGGSGTCTLQLSRSNASANGNTYGNLKFTSDTSVDVARIRATRQSAANDALLAFDTASSGTLSERMRIDSSGRVGIGTSSPDARVKINGSSAYTVANSGQSVEGLDIQATAGGSGNFGGAISLGASGSGRSAIAALQDGSDSDRTGLVFITHDSNTAADNSTEKMRLDSTGRLLIGTSVEGNESADELTINSSGNTGITLRSGTSDNTSLFFSDATSGVAEYAGFIQYQHAGNNLIFGTTSSERLRIDSSGNVGIGIATAARGPIHSHTSATTNNIHLTNGSSGTGTQDGATIFVDGTSSAGFWFREAGNLRFATDNSEKLRLDSSGRLMIGTTIEGVVNGDDLTVVSSGHTGITIRSGTSNQGNIFFSDGTSGADEYRGYFQYLHAVNALLLGTDAAERMRIDSAGRVGIGTSNIGSHQLVVEGGKAETGGSCLALKTAGGASGTLSALALYGTFVSPTSDTATRRTADITSGFATGNWGTEFLTFNVGKSGSANDTQQVCDEKMRLNSTGQLSIGAGPVSLNGHNSRLSVQGTDFSASTVAIMSNSSGVDGAYLFFAKQRSGSVGGNTSVANGDFVGQLRYLAADGTDVQSEVANISVNIDGAPGSNDTPGRITFATTNDGGNVSTERMRIDNQGNVGIGTSSLIGNSSSIYLTVNGSSLGGIALKAGNSTQGYLQGSGGTVTLSSDGAKNIRFDTNGSQRMNIASDGNVGIGKTSTSLDIDGSIFFGGGQQLQIVQSGSGGKAMNIRRRTNIGTLIQFDRVSAVGSISCNNTSTSYNTTSDYRLKENVVTLSDAITRLKTLKPYRFNFIADKTVTVDGFLAHEVTAVPEAVTGTKDAVVTQDMIDDEEYEKEQLNDIIPQGIDQAKLVPLLVAAVQELIGRVETLEAA